jgi:hypothetical protein
MSWTTSLDFCGASLSVSADLHGWTELWNRAFPSYVSMPGGHSPSFRISIETCEQPRIAHELPLTWKGLQPDGLYGEVFEDGERLIHAVEGAIVMEIDHASGTARVLAEPTAAWALHGSAIMQLVDACMGYFGRHLIHAGALVDPSSGRALMLSVRSGGGKTTTSLALSRHGFALMTDDATILGEENGQPVVWGVPRPLKVHSRTAELLPWLGPLPDRWDQHGEQPVELASLADKISLAGVNGARLGTIIDIGPRSGGGHSLTPCPKPAALIALAHENVAGRPLGVTPRARRRFAALSRAVAAADTFVLSAGTDLGSLPAAVTARLETAMS